MSLCRGTKVVYAFLLIAISNAFIPTVLSQTEFSAYQAVAQGDLASAGNLGVSVTILTHSYQMINPDAYDMFYVASFLTGGGFIQFGYVVQSGYTCLNGFSGLYLPVSTSSCETAEYIQSGDVRWFWQYWPGSLGDGFRFGNGPTMSAGLNDTWHTYSIVDNANQTWNFIFDGTQVASLNVKPTNSSEPPDEAAEQTTDGGLEPLGPAEFRNLTYFMSGKWHQVASFTTFSTCAPSCPLPNPFTAALIGNNDVIAGSLTPIPSWESYNSQSTTNLALSAIVLVGITITAIMIYHIRKKPSQEAHALKNAARVDM